MGTIRIYKFLLVAFLAAMPAVLSAQECINCQALAQRSQYQPASFQPAPQSIFVEETNVVAVPRVVTEYQEQTQTVEYRRVSSPQMARFFRPRLARQTFDVECGVAIAQDFMECTETATTRRDRRRCAFKAALQNIDCILAGFATTSTGGQRRFVLFPRRAARRAARQIVRNPAMYYTDGF